MDLNQRPKDYEGRFTRFLILMPSVPHRATPFHPVPRRLRPCQDIRGLGTPAAQVVACNVSVGDYATPTQRLRPGDSHGSCHSSVCQDTHIEPRPDCLPSWRTGNERALLVDRDNRISLGRHSTFPAPLANPTAWIFRQISPVSARVTCCQPVSGGVTEFQLERRVIDLSLRRNCQTRRITRRVPHRARHVHVRKVDGCRY